jgi:hypothetical protein
MMRHGSNRFDRCQDRPRPPLCSPVGGTADREKFEATARAGCAPAASDGLILAEDMMLQKTRLPATTCIVQVGIARQHVTDHVVAEGSCRVIIQQVGAAKFFPVAAVPMVD